MKLSVGIVGLPNVGKSTLFNALLKRQQALMANYPFATIEPNVGIASVPDDRLSVLAKIVQSTNIKPATVEFVDIAGLVAGASKGEGLGNQFLSHIRQTNLICHVLRIFDDSDIIREGAVDPKQDLDIIRTELRLADLSTLAKQLPSKGSNDKQLLAKWQAITVLKSRLDQEKTVIEWSLVAKGDPDEMWLLAVARELQLLTVKKELFVLNVSEEQLLSNQQLKQHWASMLDVKEGQILVLNAKLENELASLSSDDQKLYLADLGVSAGGIEQLSRLAYQTLNLQSFLTAGKQEVRAWTIPVGTTAVEASAVIHSDFAKMFIKAKVISFEQFVECEGWQKAKELGKLRFEGRDYVMRPDDVVEFMLNK